MTQTQITTKPTFNPTHDQIICALELFSIMALHQVVKPNYEKLEQQVIDEGDYYIDLNQYKSKNINLERLFGDDITPEGKILSAKVHCHISGLTEYCNDSNVQNDASRYYSELRRKTLNAGMLFGENTEARISNKLNQIQRKFGKLCESLTPRKICYDDIVLMEHRKALIDLLLRLFAPLCDTHVDKDLIKDEIFSEFISKSTPIIG